MSRWNVYRCGSIVRPSVRSKSLLYTLGSCKKLGHLLLLLTPLPTAPPSLPAPCHDKSVSSASLPTHARRAQHFHSKRAYAVPSTAHARCLTRTRAHRRQPPPQHHTPHPPWSSFCIYRAACRLPSLTFCFPFESRAVVKSV